MRRIRMQMKCQRQVYCEVEFGARQGDKYLWVSRREAEDLLEFSRACPSAAVLRNYEIERDLMDALGVVVAISDPCPFNGRSSRFENYDEDTKKADIVG